MTFRYSWILVVWICFLYGLEAKTLTFGHIREGDTPFRATNILRESKWFSAHDILVTHPAKGALIIKTLTGIRIIDHSKTEDQAKVSLLGGGPGYEYSKIRIESPFRSPVNLTIEYFGYADDAVPPVQDFVWGKITSDDVLIGRRVMDFPLTKELHHTEKIVFPLEGYTNKKPLSAIRVIDRTNSIASVKFISGGLGQTHTTLVVKSRHKKPLHITIEYYGQHEHNPGSNST
ncbi:uncharacterized protein LOC142240674 [Haematobia irritans]|uniref:uncharacterized protein LOC142240674 n=1 Tax=Haematobia irritans TaxID=7368 RepID=UPI003F50AD48